VAEGESGEVAAGSATETTTEPIAADPEEVSTEAEA
jgi:hypothetical protein